ncbi:MAG: signal peptidase I [bacterium JZ-2024 1]
MKPRKLEQMTEELQADFIFRDGSSYRVEADGQSHLIWIPFERTTQQPYDEPLQVRTTFGELQTMDGRKGQSVILLVRENGAWVKIRSIRHGKGILKVSFGAKTLGTATVEFLPSFRSIVFRFMSSVVSITVLVIVFRAWIIEGVGIPKELLGNSMEPHIFPGERIFLLKFIYAFRNPVHGEVIVFDRMVEGENGKMEKLSYIKRVIGVPGDRIEFKNGVLIRNGEKVEEKYLSKKSAEDDTTHPAITVPEGHFYVAGDNRPYSEDSRYWLIEEPERAFVPKKDIRGKAFLVYWPPWRIRLVRTYR